MSSLGLFQKHRPDCVFVGPDDWKDYNNYEWLDTLIQQHLSKGKIVCLSPAEEGIMKSEELILGQVLNKYIDDPVYLVTNLTEEDQKFYTFQMQIKCKIIEVPVNLLNECLGYYAVADRNIKGYIGNKNFLCMLGRYNTHKFDLACALRPYASKGLITISNPKIYPKESLDFCQANPSPPYRNHRNPQWCMVQAQTVINGIWVTSNVENFLHIEKTYADIPLMVNAETTTGIFYNTEKSLWPLLLGKLMLVYGRPGSMKNMQRFYDIDFTRYADLSFDESNNDWSDNGHRQRLSMLIERNLDLIQDCSDVYNQLQPELESARWTIGKKIYQYAIQQLEMIKK